MRTYQTGFPRSVRLAKASFRFTRPLLLPNLPGTYVTIGLLCLIAFGLTVARGQGASETLRSHSGSSLRTAAQPVTTIILVRHAEKAIVPPENKDPDISPAGTARSQELARMFGDAGVGAIYATQFKRTQQTVKPLADKLGVSVTVIEAKKTADLVQQIRTRNAGQVVFIAGHNNSVPEIIAALGGPQLPIIPETEFDNLYILTIQADGPARLLKMKYGSSLPASGQGMMKP